MEISCPQTGMELLRLLRTAAEGKTIVDAQTAAVLHREKDLLRTAAGEEAGSEMTALLCGRDVSAVLREFADVLSILIPEIVPLIGFDQHNPHHDRDVWEHTIAVTTAAPATPVMRWAALLHDIGKPACFAILEDGLGHFYGHAQESQRMAEEILTRFGIAESMRARIGELIRYHDFPIPPERKRLNRLVLKHGEETVRQLIALHIADTMGQSQLCQGRVEEYCAVESLLNALLQEEPPFSIRDLAVNGRDLMALGFQGKAIGEALRRCFDAVTGGVLPNDKDTLLRWVRSDFQ